jgi:hypothetical protein
MVVSNRAPTVLRLATLLIESMFDEL